MSKSNQSSFHGSYRQVAPAGIYSWGVYWKDGEEKNIVVCNTPDGRQLLQSDLRAGKHNQEFQSCLNAPDGQGYKLLPSAPPVQTAQKIEDGRFGGSYRLVTPAVPKTGEVQRFGGSYQQVKPDVPAAPPAPVASSAPVVAPPVVRPVDPPQDSSQRVERVALRSAPSVPPITGARDGDTIYSRDAYGNEWSYNKSTKRCYYYDPVTDSGEIRTPGHYLYNKCKDRAEHNWIR